MKDKYTHIFEPLTVRTMTIKNRICMMPMGTNYGEQNGEMSFLHIDYYRQRAKGGLSLIHIYFTFTIKNNKNDDLLLQDNQESFSLPFLDF